MKLFIVLLLLGLCLPYQCLGPSVGDIRIYNLEGTRLFKGELQIFITDGSSPLGWSSVCKTHSFDNEEAKVSCKQLGLPDGIIISEGYKSVCPKRITNIECGKSSGHRHILQCEHQIGDYSTSCPYTVFIECRNFTFTPYSGELSICPPDNSTSNFLTSISFGIVITYFYKHWKAIGNSTVSAGSANLVDLMCASMGYQKSVPGSVMTAKALFGNYTFNTCNIRVADSSWLNLSQLTCDSAHQYPCFGCCLEFPDKQACSKRSCVEDFVIIQCAFDPLHIKSNSISYEENCSFDQNADSRDKIVNYSSICQDKSPTQWNTYGKAFGGTALGELLIIIILGSCLLKYYVKEKCKGQMEYSEMTRPNGEK